MRSLFSPTFYRFTRRLLHHTFRRLYDVQMEGLAYLPTQGPAVICPKHQRWEDILVTALALPPPLHYIAKVELFQRLFIRELLLTLGGVPVDRQNPRATLSSFRTLLPLLQKKAYLVVYPEGTYVQGGVGPGKHRLIQLLLKLQGQDGLGPIPFVPMGISYHPRGLGYEVKVNLGPPLQATHPRQALDLTNGIMAQIAKLSSGSGIGNWGKNYIEKL